ncbi:MAG: hypothetical protein GY733_18965 [bacterium]|nr:hypothetical protein [bacterium]
MQDPIANLQATSGRRKNRTKYKYNGLGYRIGIYDVSTKDWLRLVYDEEWRIVAVYKNSETNPDEQFVYQNAGTGHTGGSLPIDDLILRDYRDIRSMGSLNARVYYCQNWRNDVVALINDSGEQVEQVRYSAYGVPIGIPAGDVDSDFDVDSTDYLTAITLGGYDVRADTNLDGSVDSADFSFISRHSLDTLGWRALSRAAVGNRRGFGGYEIDDVVIGTAALYHVRNRVLHSELGRWISRDSLGYADGNNLYQYGVSNPIFGLDADGLLFGFGQGAGQRRPTPPSRLPPGANPCIRMTGGDRRGEPGTEPSSARNVPIVAPLLPRIAPSPVNPGIPRAPRGPGGVCGAAAPVIGAGLLVAGVVYVVGLQLHNHAVAASLRVPIGPTIAPDYDRPPLDDCEANKQACFGRSIDDLPGDVWGKSRCEWCYLECIKRKPPKWPGHFLGPDEVRRRCDWWRFPKKRKRPYKRKPLKPGYGRGFGGRGY